MQSRRDCKKVSLMLHISSLIPSVSSSRCISAANAPVQTHFCSAMLAVVSSLCGAFIHRMGLHLESCHLYGPMQDGKYDKLLRLLYNDIEKYETEVSLQCRCLSQIWLVLCKVGSAAFVLCCTLMFTAVPPVVCSRVCGKSTYCIQRRAVCWMPAEGQGRCH